MFALLAPSIDLHWDLQMLLRWLHFVAGFTWVGMLYFFNLVNVQFMKEIDAGTKSRVVPTLMPRALWWFRMGAVVTVFVGVWYWMIIGGADARNAGASPGRVFGTFFAIWTVVWVLQYVLLIPQKGFLNNGRVLAVLIALLVIGGGYVFLTLNSHGWESNRLLSIGIGGGLGWVMMLNVWGVIWRDQKKIIAFTKESAAGGKPMPANAAYLARQAFLASRTNFWLSFPMLFFMASASHYVIFPGSK